jgi:DNA polymerase III sliding clamp (beta) subunit (PCNA family)
MHTSNVALETTAATSPGVVRPVGEDDFLYVVMPMRIGK